MTAASLHVFAGLEPRLSGSTHMDRTQATMQLGLLPPELAGTDPNFKPSERTFEKVGDSRVAPNTQIPPRRDMLPVILDLPHPMM